MDDLASLRRIIREEVRSAIDELLVTEMAFSLSDYKRKADNRVCQIITNWCLVRYASKDEKVKKLKPHWSVELMTQMSYVGELRLKNGDNIESKAKALYGIWAAYEFDRNESSVDMIVAPKFDSEGIDTYSDKYIETVSECVSSSKEIVDTILTGSRAKIMEYVRKL